MSRIGASVQSAATDFWRRGVPHVLATGVAVTWVVFEVVSLFVSRTAWYGWLPGVVLVVGGSGVLAAAAFAWRTGGAGTTNVAHARSRDDRWPLEQALLTGALALPEGERHDFIEGATQSDPALRESVLSLLRAHAGPSPLDRPIHAWVERFTAESGAPVRKGHTVGHYEILEKLGGGGMGVVFRARDLRLGRVVALKFLPPHLSHDAEAKQRFMVEAQAAAALDHTHICTLLEIGQTQDEQLFLAMPYYEGETLKRRMARGPLPLPQALDLVCQAALGLAAAHQKGIVHRDIKPANLIVTDDGVLKIVDFGVAKLTDVAVTAPEVTPGTIAYMSPEQARGASVDVRTDVWSLGVVLYETLAARRPFAGEHHEAVRQAIMSDDPPPLGRDRGDVTAEVESVVRRALSRDRSARFADGAALHAAVAKLLGRAVPDRDGLALEHVDGGPEAEDLPPGGERRQATVVVSTLGGFPHLVESLTPAQLRSLLTDVRAAAVEITERFGGTLDRADDDRLHLWFGVPESHEDHCFRGVRAALELHERVRSMSVPGDGTSLALQTGVDTGLVVARPGTGGGGLRLSGTPVTTSARLQARAGPDEVWITAGCQRLVGAFFDTVAGPPMSLAAGSVATPHRALRLSGLRTRMEASALVGLTTHVGREAEIERLRSAYDAARAGQGRVVAIVGEAGVGKSRLLHELRATVEGAAARVLEGRCPSVGGSMAYHPFIEVLRGALGLDGVDQDDRVDAVTDGIRRLAPELTDRLPLFLELVSLSHPDHPIPRHLQGDTLKHAMKEAVAGLVTVMASRQPLVLLLEDWHRADEASALVLQQLAEVAGEHALLVLVTARPPAPEVGSASRYVVLPLEPLDAEASDEMLRELLSVRLLPPDFAARVHARTTGNPFFIEEVARTLLEDGTLNVHDGALTLTGDLDQLQLPETVEAVIRGRLDRLDRGTRDVVRVASVIGREFERRLLERCMGGSRLPHAIQSLKTAGLIHQIRVVPDAAYRFNHVLTQEVAYASLLGHQRADVHRRVGEAIEWLHQGMLGEHYDRLADHFSAAEMWEKAARFGMKAANRKAAVSAFGEALRQLRTSEGWVRHLDDDDKRRDLLLPVLFRQERVSEILGRRAAQQEIIDRLLHLLDGTDDDRSLAKVYQRQGDLLTLLHRYGDAEGVLDESLTLARRAEDPFLVRNTLRSLGLLRWHQDELAEALPYIEEAIEIDKQHDDTGALIGELANLAAVLKSLGRPEDALEALTRALSLTYRRRDGLSGPLSVLNETYILHTLANVHRELGDSDTALEYLETARGVTDRERMPIQLSYHYTSLAHLKLQRGQIDEALDFYRQAVETSRTADFTLGLAQALGMLGRVLIGLDREDDGLPHLREAVSLFAQLSDIPGEAGAQCDVARAEERRGGSGRAAVAWRRAADAYRMLGSPIREVEAREGVARCLRAENRDGDGARAAHLEALECAEAAGADRVRGRMLNVLGIISWEQGDHAEALARYETALAAFRLSGDDGGVGLMLNSIALTLKASGRVDEAGARIVEALRFHRTTGNEVHEGHALAVEGELELDSGRADRALACFDESLALRERSGDREGEGWMHSRMAAAHQALDHLDAARVHVVEARRVAKELGLDELAAACDELTAAMPR